MARTHSHLTAVVLLGLVTQAALGAQHGAREYLRKGDEWYRSAEARTVADNVLSWQSPLGGWPKNEDTASKPYAGPRVKLKPTFDNGATTNELRFLARMHAATKEARYAAPFLAGLDYILKAQYPTGGWPQFYPPSAQYHRHITFNDGAMVRLMEFLREVYTDSAGYYAMVNDARKKAARGAFDRGVECILKCQVQVNGKPTAWCAQHDERDLAPRKGRTYELPALSGSESVGIVRLLMSLDHPSPEVVRAVEGAVAWFDSAKLKGIRVDLKPDPKAPKGKDKVVVEDPAAPPLWARFYDIQTNKPIYCDRDGVSKGSLAEIRYERRNGYAWLGTWPAPLLEKEYPAWRGKWRAKGAGATGAR